jgi:hypothetical protein
MFALNEDLAIKRGFVTTAEHAPLRGFTRRLLTVTQKQVHWICPSCFHEFRTALGFQLITDQTLDDVLEGPTLGPGIGI